MRLRIPVLACALLALPASVAISQPRYAVPRPATSEQLPPGISVRKTDKGDVYVDARGRTLYGLDVAALFVETRNPYKYCSGPCAAEWEPLLAPAGTPAGPATVTRGFGRNQPAPIPDWTAVEGPNGLQLLFKRTNLVFVRKGEKPGSTRWDGANGYLWNLLRYVPPQPKLVAPDGVKAVFLDGAYALVDRNERLLYTRDRKAKCTQTCDGTPLKSGLVVKDMGEWTVSRSGESPQWVYRGQPVFVSQGAPGSSDIPEGARILRP
jgi:predicted lipoprotein with Yx(FWY)xxD motif